MAKVLITQTNGASAQDISDAIGAFLDQQEKDEEQEQEEE